MSNSNSWQKIFKDLDVLSHDFSKEPFKISARQIKDCCHNFRNTAEKEVRILCKQDTRTNRPQIFVDNQLFLLPVKNGLYNIIKGEGYIDIPPINSSTLLYSNKLGFIPETSTIGDSEMQHLDFAYAASLVRTFMEDPSLVLTIRGRKYTPYFDFHVNNQKITVESVQTEVDAGYEGKDQVVLIEAKNFEANNIIIRQLYYPFRQWQCCTKKKIVTLFFEKNKKDEYSLWKFIFKDPKDYNSIELEKSAKFKIV